MRDWRARRRIGMLGVERLLNDRQRALVERPRAGKVALGLEHVCKISEARRRIGMLGAEHLIVDRQRPLVERSRSRMLLDSRSITFAIAA